MWQQLKDALSDHIQRLPHRPQIDGAIVVTACDGILARVLPADIVHRARTIKFVHGAVTISADHPAIAQRLRSEEHNILTQLQSEGHRVERLLVRIRQQDAIER